MLFDRNGDEACSRHIDIVRRRPAYNDSLTASLRESYQMTTIYSATMFSLVAESLSIFIVDSEMSSYESFYADIGGKVLYERERHL